MGLWLRTAASVALLAVFPAILLVMLFGLGVAQVLWFQRSTGDGLKWLLVIVPAAMVMIRGLRVLIAKGDGAAPGWRVREEDQPELWALVRGLAVVAETAPPDEIYLMAEANALVTEETRLLGLVSRRRRLFIGVPLVAVLRSDQLAAVLTHELAHYSNHDTRLSGLAYRGRRALVSVVRNLDADIVQKLLRFLLKSWLRLYLLVSGGLSQRQERAADAAAARAVGSSVAASALREIPVIDCTWDWFSHQHMLMSWHLGYLPSDIFGGYAEYLRSFGDQFDGMREHPAEGNPAPYDTHPPMPVRVAAIEAMAATPVVEIEPGPATGLLRDARAALDAGLVSGLDPAAARKLRVDWPTLVGIWARTALLATATPLLDRAARLTGRPRTLGAVLAALDERKVVELSGIEPPAGLGPRPAREYARPHVHKELTAAVHVVLTNAGAGHWEPDWPAFGRFVVDHQAVPDLTPLVDAALADQPDTSGLRALLDGLDHTWSDHVLETRADA
jgi:Zn-dependent protease with chaperone function